MLTLTGVFFLLSGALLAFYIDPTLSIKHSSVLIRIYFCIAIFCSQTLDAIDGKVARMRNLCSPLGQLMDHSMDCFSNSFTLIMVMSSFRMGPSIHTIISLFHIQIVFWVCNWEEHYTGTFRTFVGTVGNTEMQLSAIFAILFSCFDSEGILEKPLFLQFSFVHLLIYSNIIVGEYGFTYKIIKETLINLKGDKKKAALKGLVSPILLFTAEFLFLNSEIFKYYTAHCIYLSGMVFGFFMVKLIIATMTKNENSFLNINICLFLLVQFLINNFVESMRTQIICLILFFVYIQGTYLRYLVSVIVQLIRELKIKF